jgi:uncharacterized protein (DUF2336 family)
MDGVVDLPLEPGRERKAHVLLAASELYVARGYHDAGEERIYEELFRQLLPETPTSQRLAIARLLAAYDHPPECCLEELAADADETVAAAALSGTAPLGEATLIAAVGRGPERVRAAIATRPGLAAPVRLALARHAAPSTLKRMLALAPVGPDDDILDVLFTRPEVLGELAVPLARHHVLPASLLFALFLDLDEAGRMEALAAAETRALADLARRGDPRVLHASFKPEVLRHLVDAALSGGAAAFAAHLAYTLDLDGETAARIVEDRGGEALMVALRALGTNASESGRIAVRVLGQRLPLERLRALLALHDRMTPHASHHLMRGLSAGLDAALREAREAASVRAISADLAPLAAGGEGRHVPVFTGQARGEGRVAVPRGADARVDTQRKGAIHSLPGRGREAG